MRQREVRRGGRRRWVGSFGALLVGVVAVCACRADSGTSEVSSTPGTGTRLQVGSSVPPERFCVTFKEDQDAYDAEGRKYFPSGPPLTVLPGFPAVQVAFERKEADRAPAELRGAFEVLADRSGMGGLTDPELIRTTDEQWMRSTGQIVDWLKLHCNLSYTRTQL